jgi:hypothetical protein
LALVCTVHIGRDDGRKLTNSSNAFQDVNDLSSGAFSLCSCAIGDSGPFNTKVIFFFPDVPGGHTRKTRKYTNSALDETPANAKHSRPDVLSTNLNLYLRRLATMNQTGLKTATGYLTLDFALEYAHLFDLDLPMVKFTVGQNTNYQIFSDRQPAELSRY